MLRISIILVATLIMASSCQNIGSIYNSLTKSAKSTTIYTKPNIVYSKPELSFEDKYFGEDKEELTQLAINAVKSSVKDATILHTNFKHGWALNESFSGGKVIGHTKRCRIYVHYKDGNNKYYFTEATFEMRAPLGSDFTKMDWPALAGKNEVTEDEFNEAFEKYKQK